MTTTPLGLRSGTQRHWHPCNHPSCQQLAERQLDMLREDVEPWLAARTAEADAALVELKKVDLVGPLTAEEWLEFRLRSDEEEDHELLRCCANTSAIRDDLFHLMRNAGTEADALLGRGTATRAWAAFRDHGLEGWSPRARELMERVRAYYAVDPAAEWAPGRG